MVGPRNISALRVTRTDAGKPAAAEPWSKAGPAIFGLKEATNPALWHDDALIRNRVNAVPVIDDGGRVLGAVSQADLRARSRMHTARCRMGNACPLTANSDGSWARLPGASC
jgi:hypothetical protein